MKLRATLGYIWASIAILLVFVMFIGNHFLAETLINTTGLKISPWCDGGEVTQTLEYDTYKVLVHRPVFDGLTEERSQGFVQVDWKSIGKPLPETVYAGIDYDQDGVQDFHLVLNTQTNEATLEDAGTYVLGIEQVYDLKTQRAVRIRLKHK